MQRIAVTGAFGYVGREIATRAIAEGMAVTTLTSRTPDPGDPLAGVVDVRPLDFRRPDRLVEALTGVDTLYDTYWVRFPRGAVTHERAVAETSVLIAAARAAGVRRFVLISITGADPSSDLSYFRGKGELEAAVRASGMSWAIVRPTLVFGGNDILVNDMAWLLRRLPVMGIPGDGSYRVRPVHVRDVGEIAVRAGLADEDVTVDAVGPETLRYRDLVQCVADAVGVCTPIVPMPPWVVAAAAGVLGAVVRDVVLTRAEIDGLMAGLLVSDGPTTGSTVFTEWVAANGATLGRTYANELRRHYAG
jgi:uncharacterized protein YbjT (DUF2867 family)